MNKTNHIFNIISFTAIDMRYYPASMKLPRVLAKSGTYIKHTDVNIPIGHSRFGGPVVDLPEGVAYPKNMYFAAQLDLSKFSPFDQEGILPQSGQLIIFSDLHMKKGKVIYADVPKEKLVRVVKDHEKSFWDGVLIDKIFSDKESFQERFRDPEDEDEKEYANEDGKLWDHFAGCEKSKLFGICTNCNWEQEQIEAITLSDKVLLLQIGENGFNDEGVFSVLINKKDLENRNFDKCEFMWGQS